MLSLGKNVVSFANLGEFYFWRELPDFPSYWSLGNLSSENISVSIAYCIVAYCVVYSPIGIRPENFYLCHIYSKIIIWVTSDFTVNVHRTKSGIFLLLLKDTLSFKYQISLKKCCNSVCLGTWAWGDRNGHKLQCENIALILFLKSPRLEYVTCFGHQFSRTWMSVKS